MLAIDDSVAPKSETILPKPTVIPFGTAVRFVNSVRDFVYENGDPQTIADYKETLKDLVQPAANGQKLSQKEKLELEIYHLSNLFKAPDESLQSVEGLHGLFQQFKEYDLGKVAGGFDEVQIAEPDPHMTWQAIAVDGLGEAIKNLWAAKTYRI